MSTIITESLSEPNTPASYSIADHPVFEPLIREYIAFQSKIQQAENPSGDLWTGGLNEPKFMADGSRFDGEWGRPQR
jgi:glucoamylase